MFLRKVTGWALPGLSCPCCGTVTFADPPPGAHQGPVSYGPVLNAAAVLLSCYGNVPPERAAHVIAMLLSVPVSEGFADKAAARMPAPAGTLPLTRKSSMTCADATTPPSPPDHPQPAAGPGHRKSPGIQPRDVAAGLQGTGFPVHSRIRRELDKQRLRTRSQGREAPSGRLRLLAQPRHARPLVPPAQLPGLGRRPRRHRTRRHPRRHRGKALATATPRHQLTPNLGTP
jgi:hypothetical protein